MEKILGSGVSVPAFIPLAWAVLPNVRLVSDAQVSSALFHAFLRVLTDVDIRSRRFVCTFSSYLLIPLLSLSVLTNTPTAFASGLIEAFSQFPAARS